MSDAVPVGHVAEGDVHRRGRPRMVGHHDGEIYVDGCVDFTEVVSTGAAFQTDASEP